MTAGETTAPGPTTITGATWRADRGVNLGNEGIVAALRLRGVARSFGGSLGRRMRPTVAPGAMTSTSRGGVTCLDERRVEREMAAKCRAFRTMAEERIIAKARAFARRLGHDATEVICRIAERNYYGAYGMLHARPELRVQVEDAGVFIERDGADEVAMAHLSEVFR